MPPISCGVFHAREVWIYGALCGASGRSPVYILSRVKQWLRMANHGGNLAWFDALKSCQDLGELLHNLSERAMELSFLMARPVDKLL